MSGLASRPAGRYERLMKQFAVTVAISASLAAPAGAQAWLGFAREKTERAFAEPPAAAPPLALPDPTMTPGAVDAGVTLGQICNGTTKERRRVSPATRAKVLSDYSVTDAGSVAMEMDHLVPLALGGANAAANLWPQPWLEAAIKDRLEVEMQRRACVAYRTLAPAEAAEVLRQEQREIVEDWPAAARRYLGAGRR